MDSTVCVCCFWIAYNIHYIKKIYILFARIVCDWLTNWLTLSVSLLSFVRFNVVYLVVRSQRNDIEMNLFRWQKRKNIYIQVIQSHNVSHEWWIHNVIRLQKLSQPLSWFLFVCFALAEYLARQVIDDFSAIRSSILKVFFFGFRANHKLQNFVGAQSKCRRRRSRK